MVEVTILMPCLNEAETVGMCIRKAADFLKTTGICGEILVADNGSTDGSQAIAAALGARVVTVEMRGYGAAVLGGIKAANGTYVIMGDADDSYDFSDLQTFVDRLRAGADLVIGNRFSGGIAESAMPPLHRYLGNPVLSLIGRVFYRTEVGDFHCGLRGFNRAAIDALRLRTAGMEFASEMIVRASLAGYRIEDVPTTLSPAGRSRAPHLRPWRDGWRHLRFLLVYSPRWLFFYPGLLLLVIGLGGVVALLPGAVRLGDVLLDRNSLVASCFAFLIGLQSVTFGILVRRIATRKGLLPERKWLNPVLEAMTLERNLLGAVLLVLVGIAGAVWSFYQWAGLGFGELNDPVLPRVFTFSLTLISSGVLLALTSFLASVIDLLTTD
jgi:glycosyltransferase involved in cell wall biosynthesis